MNAIDRKEQQIHDAMTQLGALTGGHAVMSPKALKLRERISRLTAELDAMRQHSSSSLGTALPEDEKLRNEVYRQIIKIPIAADYLYACCVDLRGTLSRHGIDELTLTRQIQQIRDLSKQLAFTLSQFKPLERILSDDDTLIAALDKKTDSYLTQRMRIT